MASTAAQMTMAANVWFAENRRDLPNEISMKLSKTLGEVAEHQKWVAPVADFDADAAQDDFPAFLDNGEALLKSVQKSTGDTSEISAVLSSVANLLGWKVPA